LTECAYSWYIEQLGCIVQFKYSWFLYPTVLAIVNCAIIRYIRQSGIFPWGMPLARIAAAPAKGGEFW